MINDKERALLFKVCFEEFDDTIINPYEITYRETGKNVEFFNLKSIGSNLFFDSYMLFPGKWLLNINYAQKEFWEVDLYKKKFVKHELNCIFNFEFSQNFLKQNYQIVDSFKDFSFFD